MSKLVLSLPINNGFSGNYKGESLDAASKERQYGNSLGRNRQAFTRACKDKDSLITVDSNFMRVELTCGEKGAALNHAGNIKTRIRCPQESPCR